MQTVQFEPVSNREDWIQQCKVFDTSGALSDLTGALIVLTVRERQTEIPKLQAHDSGRQHRHPGHRHLSVHFSVFVHAWA